jgi:uncharacterized membrane protein
MDQTHLTTLFVHFPIALILVSTTLYAIAAVLRSQSWTKELFITSRWCLYIAALVSGLAIISGWNIDPTMLNNEGYKTAIENHKFWGLLTAIAIISYGLISVVMRKVWGKKHIAVTMVSLVVLGCLVIVTGKFGIDQTQYLLGGNTEEVSDSEEAEEYAPIHTEDFVNVQEEADSECPSDESEDDSDNT